MQTQQSETPLSAAVRMMEKEELDLVELLLKSGADLDQPAKAGIPREMAKKKKNDKLTGLFERYGRSFRDR